MDMNIHPVLVHFPIALFTVYAVLELIRFKKINNQPYWFYVKGVLAITAAAGAGAAYLFGDIAKEAIRNGAVKTVLVNSHQVIELHETWAKASLIISILLAAAYLCLWLNKYNAIEKLPGQFLKLIWRMGTGLSRFFVETPTIFAMVILGLIAITVTGALGGAIVYGPDADPIVRMIYGILIK
jgi:uncharacterized membrane protein